VIVCLNEFNGAAMSCIFSLMRLCFVLK
jgi:hypothetical protein